MKNDRTKSQRRRERTLVLALSLLFLSAALFSVFVGFIAPPSLTDSSASGTLREVVVKPTESADPLPSAAARRPDCFMILVSGLDDGNGGSDTNILVRFDAGNGTIDLVSLPRDTLLHHEWRSNKLNFAYAKGGTELLRQEVSNLLGVPVDYTVTVDLTGFIRLVDQIGGVDFEIPVDMDYDDPAQDLHIHFSKGLRHLNGQEAMEVVRWRKNNDGTGYATADIGRIGTQQAFLKAVAQKALTLNNVPALADMFFSCVKTDSLTTGNLIWLGNEARKIGMDGVSFHTLPGNGAASYHRESVYALDREATLALVNEALNPYVEPITADRLDILVP